MLTFAAISWASVMALPWVTWAVGGGLVASVAYDNREKIQGAIKLPAFLKRPTGTEDVHGDLKECLRSLRHKASEMRSPQDREAALVICDSVDALVESFS